MFKNFVFLILGVLLFTSSGFAANVNQGTISSPESVCDDGARAVSNENWYINSLMYPRDVFYGDTGYDWIFGRVSTKVDVYNPYGLLNINGGFQWYSEGKPAGSSDVIVFQNFAGSSLTGIPASTNTLVAQLVYHTSRKSSNTFAGGAFSMVYTPVATGTPTTKNYASAPTFNSAVTTKNECVNIYARWCGDGLISNGEACDPADPAKNGWGVGGCNVSCQPVNTPPATPSLKIKKYVKSIATGDSQISPVSVSRGETFNYLYTLENDSSATAPAKDVVVKDTLPDNLTFAGNITVKNASNVDVTNDWICTKGTYNATTRITLICSKKTDLPTNSGVYTFTVPVTLSLTAPVGISMQNIVYACASNATSSPTGPSGEIICGTPNPPPPPPIGQCDPLNPDSKKDPACIEVPNPTPTCDSLTVTPSAGQVPFNAAVSCNATNASTFLIDCGNSTSVTASGGICRYTAAGTFTPKCTVNGTTTSLACTKTVTGTVTPPPTAQVSIKKYAKEITAQGDTQTSPIAIQPGENYNYYYQIQNTGAIAATDVMVKDTLPQYLNFTTPIIVKNASNTDVTNDWTILTGSSIFVGETLPRLTFIAKKKTPLPANSGLYTFTIPVAISLTIPSGTTLHNVAYVCASNDPTSPAECGTDTPPPPPPGGCASTVPGSHIDPACVTVTESFDLTLKKYVKSDDNFSSVNPTEDFNYNIIVTNEGIGVSSGLTTVRDILPAPVVLQTGKVPSGNGWDCSTSVGANITCTTSTSVTAHQVFNTITVPARVTNLTNRAQAYVNYAYVSNPNEAVGKRCRTDGALPDPSLGGTNGQTPENVCTEDQKNFDPASINTPSPTGFDLGLTKFINGNDNSARANADGSVNYTFVVHNFGPQASTGRTYVRDTDFPTGVTLLTITATQNGWTCTNTGNTVGNTANKNGFECFREDSLGVTQDYPTITVVARAEPTAPVGTLRNVACLSNPNDPNENAVYNPNLGQYKINNCNPANLTVVAPGTFDLTIQKKVGNNLTDGSLKDRNTVLEGNGEQNILIIGQGAPLVYTYEIKNLGPVTATGLTTVEDTLPTGITISGSVQNQNGWACTSGANNNRSWSCTRTEDLALGATFPTIIVFAKSDAAILDGIYSNIATVRNPGDSNANNNTDPANVKVVSSPNCSQLTASPSTSPNAPNTPVTYACTAAGYTGLPANLEYKIICGTSDLGFTGTNTRLCNLPNANSSTLETTCSVRDKTAPTVIFSGSLVGACRSVIATTGGGGGGGGGAAYVGKKCVNGGSSCANYTALSSCELEVGVGNCDVADGAGLLRCQNKVLLCGGGGGGGGGGPPGYCGDGILQPAGQDHIIGTADDEECDVRGGNGILGGFCSSTCKLNTLTTNPGANPITDIWMTIPLLSSTNARLGYSWLETDGTTGKIPFRENRMVLGEGTRAFTLADTVGFGIKTQLRMPLLIESNKLMCLSSTGTSLNSNEICTRFGQYVDASLQTETICGTNYVILGKGDYQKPRNCMGPIVYDTLAANSANNITLFKGNAQYAIPPNTNPNVNPAATLSNAFLGRNQNGTESSLILSNGSITTNPLGAIPLVALGVRVSGAKVGGSAGTVNRGIESYIQAGNLLNLFLVGIRSNSTTTTNTNVISTRDPIAPIHLNTNPSAIGDHTVGSIADLEVFAVNGNKNILSVKGNLTIDSCGSNRTLTLNGVRSVVVEGGDLIIRCNTVYASNDANASWSFIVKDGNILLDPGVSNDPATGITNIAGVYVSVGNLANASCSLVSTGHFCSLGGGTSQRILKVDGSLYGDAKPLFDSRLYVRGTNAYDILTTGVILSYSNRALVSPPPLLSQYLNNYTVTRVVK